MSVSHRKAPRTGSAETKEQLAFLLTKPALRNLPLCRTESELVAWLSLLVEFFQSNEQIDAAFLEDTLEILRKSIENLLSHQAQSCVEASKTDSLPENTGPRALESLLQSLDLIIRVVLETVSNDGQDKELSSEGSKGRTVSKISEEQTRTVRSTASSALKTLSGWFSANEPTKSAAPDEQVERSAIQVLLRASPTCLCTVSEVYQQHPSLYRRCKSIVEGFLVSNLPEYIIVLGTASAELSSRSVYVNEDALRFLRSIVKLSAETESVTLPELYTTVNLVGNAIAFQQGWLLSKSTSRGRALQHSEKQLMTISLPRAGVALMGSSVSKSSSSVTHGSKSHGNENKQSIDDVRERYRLISRCFMTVGDELRTELAGHHTHVLMVANTWTGFTHSKEASSDEALAALRNLIDGLIMNYVEPACPLVLLQTVQKFIRLSNAERSAYPLAFLERIRALIETVVGIAGEDWHLPSSPESNREGSQSDIRLAFSILAMECLAMYSASLIEIVFQEDRTMRKKMLCAVGDVALRALKVPSETDQLQSSAAIVKELVPTLGTFGDILEEKVRDLSDGIDIQVTADAQMSWKCDFGGDLHIGYSIRAAELIYRLLEPAIYDDEDEDISAGIEGVKRSKWRVRDLQERLLAVLEDRCFFRNKNRLVLRFLGPCFCAIFRHNDALQLPMIGEISSRNQGQTVTPSVLFQARDISADEARSLRRIAFIMFYGRIAEFAAQSRPLLRRLEANWRKNDPQISAACFLLLRVIILRSPPEHILGFRAVILSETMRILRLAAGEPHAALAAIKFVDQLLLLNISEFSYAQSLFFTPVYEAEQPSWQTSSPADVPANGTTPVDDSLPLGIPVQQQGLSYLTDHQSRLRPKPILSELAEGVHGLGDALPPMAGMPIRINPSKFLRADQNYGSASTSELPQPMSSASSTDALRALRSYAQALCLRCSDRAIAYAPPCILAIEQWIESEFLSAPELLREMQTN
jgi:hypothetical protein